MKETCSFARQRKKTMIYGVRRWTTSNNVIFEQSTHEDENKNAWKQIGKKLWLIETM
jgi:hypothetical protein